MGLLSHQHWVPIDILVQQISSLGLAQCSIPIYIYNTHAANTLINFTQLTLCIVSSLRKRATGSNAHYSPLRHKRRHPDCIASFNRIPACPTQHTTLNHKPHIYMVASRAIFFFFVAYLSIVYGHLISHKEYEEINIRSIVPAIT